MIQSLLIRGFKRFTHREFEFAPLTILAGLNGSGKTSLIHALLIARETAREQSKTSVRLNGPFGLELGSAEDVRSWNAGDEITYHIRHGSDLKATWRFAVPANAGESFYLQVMKRPEKPPFAFTSEPRSFNYLCAERLGPRSLLGISALPAQALEIGVQGEHCAQIISELGNLKLGDEDRLHPERESGTAPLLKYELERWLREIVRPVEIDAELHPGTLATALRFRTPGGEWVRAPNMGFGVSYALPVVLAGLVAAAGGLLLVENPETHLHPVGQSRMGVFLAWLASRGVQVILETHSDHIVNGVRRAIGEYRYLEHAQAKVLFFDSDPDDALEVTALDFTSTGGVSDWPRGFFDQYQIDVAALGRVRRRV